MAPRVLISDKLSPAAVQIFKDRGIDEVVQTLKRLADEHGDRFQPHTGWADLQK